MYSEKNKKIEVNCGQGNGKVIGDSYTVSIKDNGIGFSSKNFNELLKPYYTTKKNGTGLGLPIVNKIINDHNGTLKLIEKKLGAEIKINLPI